MEIGALLKTFIYIIASSLLYPVLFLLSIVTLWIFLYTGAIFAEWIARKRKRDFPPEKITTIVTGDSPEYYFSHRAERYVSYLKSLMNAKKGLSDIETENVLQEAVLKLLKSLDRIKMLVRIGPGLGLIGTLIPMGTGLAALSQGDMTKLSSDLVIAFTTTVVGLATGLAAYFYYTVKRRWVDEDIKNIEMATEVLAGNR